MDQQLLNSHGVDIPFEAARHQKFCECSGFLVLEVKFQRGPVLALYAPSPKLYALSPKL